MSNVSGVRSGLKLLTRKPKAPKIGTGELGKVSETRSSSSDASPSPPKPPFFYRARGIFGALLSLNLFVAGYMLFRGPSKRHNKEGEEHNERGDVVVQSSSNRHDRQQNHSRDNLIPPKTENIQKTDDVQKSEDLQTNENKQSVEKAPPPDEAPLAVMGMVTERPVEVEATQEGVVNEVVDTFLPSNTSRRFEVPKPPVSVEQQKEILNWILTEKRKLKPSLSEEKKKIDTEKRLLKDFLRAKSFPTLT